MVERFSRRLCVERMRGFKPFIQPRIRFHEYDIALQSASALFECRMIGSSSVCPRNLNSAKP
jgi:hypothetical protein